MIKVITKEYEEGGIAYKEVITSFFGIPLYREKHTTTNNGIVRNLTKQRDKLRVKGFS